MLKREEHLFYSIVLSNYISRVLFSCGPLYVIPLDHEMKALFLFFWSVSRAN
jgi:hypothetical protein